MRVRKIQTSVSNRRSSGGLEAARARYISRAAKSGRAGEIKFANSASFKKQYNQRVRANIVSRTNKAIDQVVKSQQIGSEGRRLLRRTLSANKIGTKKALQSVTSAAKLIKKGGLRKFINRKGFVRGIKNSERISLTTLELLRLKTRDEFYFKERKLLMKFNDDRGNEKLERQIKSAYKIHKSDEATEFMDDALGLM